MFKRISAFSLVLMLAALTFGANEWVTTGKTAEFPNEMYFVGVGMSDRGMDAAKNNAQIEVKKQISVSVNSTILDQMSSSTINGSENFSSKSESRAMLTTSGDVQGIQVVQTTQQGKLFYALAVLDKANFVSNTKTKIQELKKDLNNMMTGAKTDITAGKIGQGLKKLSAAKKDILDIMEQRTLLSAATQVTDAEKVDVSQNDISALYEKCVASIKVAKTAGDNQELSVGMVPEIPFAIQATADGTPVSGTLVELRDDMKKLIMTKFTDDAGTAEFSLGENANTAVGSHSFIAALKLPVSSNLQKVLEATNQTFTYKVKSNPCYAKIEVRVPADLSAFSADLTDKAIKLLTKYDVMEDKESEYTVQVAITAKEAGTVTGLSEANTFVKSDVTLAFALLQDNKNVVAFQKAAKGQGSSYAKSVGMALSNAAIKADIKLILEKICNGGAEGPKKLIAVFPFKNSTNYSDWYNVAEALSDMLITKLINSKKFDVVERSQLNKIMEEKSMAMSGVVEQSEAMQAAQMAGAELILIGSASVVAGKIEVDARIIDAKRGVALCSMSSSGFDLANLRALADDINAKIKMSAIK
ncbi:MAG: CsgG/HfaB family protein [Fibrobacterota bacterium]